MGSPALQQDSNFKRNIIIYLFIHSLFNKTFWSWASVLQLFCWTWNKVVSRTVIGPVLEDLQSNKECVLNFIKEKYKLCGYERKSELQI